MFCLQTCNFSKGQWGMLLLGFCKGPHHSSPRSPCRTILPNNMAKTHCTSLSTCALRVLQVLRSQSNNVVAVSKGSSPLQEWPLLNCTSQRKGDKVTLVSAFMVSLAPSDCPCRCPAALAGRFAHALLWGARKDNTGHLSTRHCFHHCCCSGVAPYHPHTCPTHPHDRKKPLAGLDYDLYVFSIFILILVNL